jgi:hypothetical protein
MQKNKIFKRYTWLIAGIIRAYQKKLNANKTAPINDRSCFVNKPTIFLRALTTQRFAILTQIRFQCAAIPGFL